MLADLALKPLGIFNEGTFVWVKQKVSAHFSQLK
jgi:hypothetical protein